MTMLEPKIPKAVFLRLFMSIKFAIFVKAKKPDTQGAELPSSSIGKYMKKVCHGI